MIDSVRPGGVVLDLQVIRPNPIVETRTERLSRVDGRPLFRLADAATAAVNQAIRAGLLTEEASDDHDVRKHYPAGADVVADFADKKRRILDPKRVRGLPAALRRPRTLPPTPPPRPLRLAKKTSRLREEGEGLRGSSGYQPGDANSNRRYRKCAPPVLRKRR
jgi:hypothetical protein